MTPCSTARSPSFSTSSPARSSPRPTSRGRAGRGTRRARRPSAAIVRVIWKRDEGRCKYTSADGHRCEETRRVVPHHLDPWVLAGDATTPDAYELRCHATTTMKDGSTSANGGARRARVVREQPAPHTQRVRSAVNLFVSGAEIAGSDRRAASRTCLRRLRIHDRRLTRTSSLLGKDDVEGHEQAPGHHPQGRRGRPSASAPATRSTGSPRGTSHPGDAGQAPAEHARRRVVPLGSSTRRRAASEGATGGRSRAARLRAPRMDEGGPVRSW